jgi:MFS family permease
MVQSTWALGYAAAAFVSAIVLKYSDWRKVFFVGVLPALLVLWIRKDVPESEMWLGRKDATAAAPQVRFFEIFSRPYIKATTALLFMNFFGMFAWWGLFTWIPSYLTLPVSSGGRGFDTSLMTVMLVALNLTGMFPGYGTFGWMADRLGRKKACVLYTFMASVLVLLYARATDPKMLLLLGTPVAFFATGFFSGSGIIGSEVFPTRVRARALGFTYNGARTMSSIAPTVIGYVGQKYGLGSAFFLCSASLFLSMLSATFLPETKGKILE